MEQNAISSDLTSDVWIFVAHTILTNSMAGLQFKHSSISMVLVLSKHQMSLERSYECQGTVANNEDYSQQWSQINKTHFTKLLKDFIQKRKNISWYKSWLNSKLDT